MTTRPSAVLGSTLVLSGCVPPYGADPAPGNQINDPVLGGLPPLHLRARRWEPPPPPPPPAFYTVVHADPYYSERGGAPTSGATGQQPAPAPGSEGDCPDPRIPPKDAALVVAENTVLVVAEHCRTPVGDHIIRGAVTHRKPSD
jgi:hypothetical protein